MRTIMIDGEEHTVLAGDPDRAQAEPGKHGVTVMHVTDGEAAIREVTWEKWTRRGNWESYPEGTVYVPVAALREALAALPGAPAPADPRQLELPLGTASPAKPPHSV